MLPFFNGQLAASTLSERSAGLVIAALKHTASVAPSPLDDRANGAIDWLKGALPAEFLATEEPEDVKISDSVTAAGGNVGKEGEEEDELPLVQSTVGTAAAGSVTGTKRVASKGPVRASKAPRV